MKERILKILSIVLIVLVSVCNTSVDVIAESKEVQVDIVEFNIENLKHEDIDRIYFTDTFYLKIKWDGSEHSTDIHEGDYFDIQLPDSMRFPPDTTAKLFDIKDEDGNIIAKAEVFPGPNQHSGGYVRCTFTDYVEDKYDLNGTIYLAAKFNRNEVVFNDENAFTINIGSEYSDTNIYVKGPKELVNEVIAKWAGKVNDNNYRAAWHVRIDHLQMNLSNVVVSDTLDSDVEQLIPDTFLLRKVVFDDYGDIVQVLETIDLTDKLVFSDDLRTFTLNIGDINGEQYHLDYQSTYTPGTTLKNDVKLTSTERNNHSSTDYTSAESGGSGSGSLANKIKIVKVEKGNETIDLAGATFSVTGPDGNTFELTTGSDGSVTSGILRQGTYIAREVVAPAGYVLSENEYEFVVSSTSGTIQTIENEPITTEVSVEKKWNGTSLSQVTVHLYADGVDTGKTVDLSWRNNFKDTFTDLRKYNAEGNEIIYSVEEDEYFGYIPEISGDKDNGFIITNTLETVEITIEKKWIGPFLKSAPIINQVHANDFYIVVDLYAENTPVEQVYLSEATGWTYTFYGLRKYDPYDGHEYVYRVDEVRVPDGFDKEIDGLTIINRNIEETQVEVTKKWIGPADQKVPVTVRLYADDVQTDRILSLSEENNWTGKFTNLFKYNQETGKEVVFRVEEEPIENYQTEISGDQENGFIITNRNIETINIGGKKIWNDSDDQDGKRPTEITVRLFRNDFEIENITVYENDNWEYEFTDLEKYDDEGNLFTYIIKEDPVSYYESEYDGYDIINKYTSNKISIKVNKIWDDSYNQDGKRPDSVIIHLLKDDVDTGNTLLLNSDNNWSGFFEDLDEYSNKIKINYTVEEQEVSGYKFVIEGNQDEGYTITNSYDPELINISGTKTWIDNNNQDGKRPENITVRLCSNGNEIDFKTVSETDNWSYEFNDLPKYSNGEEIIYSISEDRVDEYVCDYDGLNIINTHSPDKTNLNVIKVWNDGNDVDRLRPDKITVRLLENGEYKGKYLVLDKDNNFKGNFIDLDVYEEGKLIEYSILEDKVDKYTTEISGDSITGYTITNTYIPRRPIPHTGVDVIR